jgi:competence ComEA-like helix-hairpin-helix protein
VLVIFLPDVYRLFYDKDVDDKRKEEFEREILAFQKSLKAKDGKPKRIGVKNHPGGSTSRAELFTFDPNEITFKECKMLGMSGKQANTLLNYRKAGGSFIYKEDLQKIYGITGKLYSTLEPFIKLPSRNEIFAKKTNPAGVSNTFPEPLKEEKLSININSADYHELIKLHGIGDVLANRIIKYRDLLGGFHDVDQIVEVFGITAKTYGLIEGNIHAEGKLSRLNINSAAYKDLLRHPYLTKYEVKGILRMRKLNGKIDSVEMLSANNILPDSVYAKIYPYLSVQ